MPSVSTNQIPKSFRANRPKALQWLGRTVLSFFGWKVNGGISDEYAGQKLVVGVATIAGLDAKITFIGKHTVFKYFGLGAFMRYMGGIPVDRTKPGGIIQDAIDQIREINGTLIGMAPEGTRSKVKEWKTGFLRIAEELNTKIVPASIDFAKKEILLGKIFTPSGDNLKDIADLKNYYKTFTPKHPENF